MNRGYVKLWRKVKDSGIVEDGPMCQVFFKALLDAAYTPSVRKVGRQSVEIQPGEFIFGRNQWARELGLSPKVVRGRIKKLENRDTIKATQRANEFTIYSFVNWDTYARNYEGEGQAEDHPKGQPRANQGPHLKKGKKGKNKYPSDFEELWTATAKLFRANTGKKAAFNSWKSAKDKPPVSELIEIIKSQSKSWKPGYEPMMTTWFNQGRWDTAESVVSSHTKTSEQRRAEYDSMPPEMQQRYASEFMDVLGPDELREHGLAVQ